MCFVLSIMSLSIFLCFQIYMDSNVFKVTCDQMEQGFQLARERKFAVAKIILLNSSEVMMGLLRNKSLTLQESTLAQQ